jgi:hypothetical protein
LKNRKLAPEDGGRYARPQFWGERKRRLPKFAPQGFCGDGELFWNYFGRLVGWSAPIGRCRPDAWGGPAWLSGLSNLLGSTNQMAVGHVYEIGVAYALDPANALPFISGGFPRTVASESAGASSCGDGGPNMFFAVGPPVPTRYASGWRWVKDPWKSYPGVSHRGGWVPTGWTTDPALAVTAPTLTPHGKPINRH